MKLLRLLKINKDRGSATVEAVISFTGFLFAIFTILNVVNFCRAQMLISNAVDTATKEITQYSYFYKMSGLEDFSKQISDNAETGKTNLNDVIGTVGDLYSSVGTAVDNTAENATNIKNAVETGDTNLDSIQNTLAGLKTDGTNIETSMNSVLSAFESVQDNPLLYMKSIIAVAGNESLDLLKSHVIAAPLARMFTAKHFGSTTTEANKTLKGLGVVDGLDGMNFKMSTIFSSDEPESVHIVVYYKLRIIQLFGWTTLEVPMCKESVAQAWLGGDDVKVMVEPMVAVTPEEESGDTTTTEEENNKESKEPEEQKEDEQGASGSTGYWAYEDPYYMSKRQMAFADYLDKTMGVEHLSGDLHYNPYTENAPVAYSCHAYDKWEYDPNKPAVSGAKLLETNAKGCIDHIVAGYATKDDGVTPVDFSGYVYVVYIPENMPESQRKQLESDVETAKKNIAEYAKKQGLPDNFAVSINVNPINGNYDYGSEE